MSQENVEVVRSFYDAYMAENPSRAEAVLDPEFEFIPAPTSHMIASHGPKEFNRLLADMMNQFESYAVVPDEFIEAGDDRVVVSLQRKAKSHGVEVEDRLAHLLTVRGGRIRRIASFSGLAEALEAARLRE
jgi:ketosteroid isomerase-like protein